ncbi:MAG: IS91 family transposase [Deltaproteobacteria bacterium]|nr:IS91 family transposase [Deltaproteobacteria bacterium]
MADIFRRFGPAYLRSHVMSPEQGQVLRHIISCRTPALGGRLSTCDHCKATFTRYYSCRDRHCPTCQGAQQLGWIERRLDRVLPTHHFHVVLTLPAELRPLALANRRVVYDLLFAAATDTLLELAATHWRALPGITAVLHTWTRQLELHPHLHCIVTGGGLGLDPDDGWIASDPDFLFHVAILSSLFRGKFMAGLVAAHAAGDLHFAGTSAHLAEAEHFTALRRLLYSTDWITYAKRPFGGPEQVVRYLGRYTHRVGTSSSRLVAIDDHAVTFRTHGHDTCTLELDEFIRRFLMHVLPKGFRKIRHYGLLAPSNVPTKLVTARQLLDGARRQRGESAPLPLKPNFVPPDPSDRQCPKCQVGRLYRFEIPPARAPPVPP